MRKTKTNQDGQATVELALLIPFLCVFLLLIVQIGIVVRQHVLVANAARAAARELSVNPNKNYALSLAHKNVPNAKVSISRPLTQGSYLTVRVKDSVKSPLPIIGVILPDIDVIGTCSMRVEK